MKKCTDYLFTFQEAHNTATCYNTDEYLNCAMFHEWNETNADAEHHSELLNSIVLIWETYAQDVEDLQQRLDSIEQTLHSDDDTDGSIKDVLDAVENHQTRIDSVNKQASELETRGVRLKTSPSNLTYLNDQWKHILDYLKSSEEEFALPPVVDASTLSAKSTDYHQAVQPTHVINDEDAESEGHSLETVVSRSRNGSESTPVVVLRDTLTESSDEIVLAEEETSHSESTPTATENIDAVLSPLSSGEFSDFARFDNNEDLENLISRVNSLRSTLVTSPELSRGDYDAFSEQDDCLKAVKEEMDEVGNSVTSAESRVDELLNNASEEDKQSLNSIMVKLRNEWTNLCHEYDNRQSQLTKALEQWQHYHCDMNDMNSWLNEAQNTLSLSRREDGSLCLDIAQNYQKDLEEGVSIHQFTLSKVNNVGQEIIKHLSAPDAAVLSEKLEATSKKWRIVCSEINDRKTRLEDQIYLTEFSKAIHEIFFTFDELETILAETIRPVEEKNMDELYSKLKDCDADLTAHIDHMNAVNDLGHKILGRCSLSQGDHAQTQTELNTLHDRCTFLREALAEKCQKVEERLRICRAFTVDINELSTWIEKTNKELQKCNGSASKLICNDMRRYQKMFDKINNTYSKLSEEYIQLELEMPSDIREKVAMINEGWMTISSIVDDSPEQAETKLKYEETKPVASPVDMNKDEKKKESYTDMYSAIGELRDWLVIMQRQLRFQRVDIGDISDIEETSAKHARIVADVDSRKPALERLMSSVKDKMKDSDVKQQISFSEKVERLRETWEDSNNKVKIRKNQLDDMLLECRQFEEMQAEFERWAGQVDDELQGYGKVGESASIVEKQLLEQKKIKEEIDQRQRTVKGLNRMAEKLVDEYKQDDPSKIKQNIDHINAKFSSLQNRVSSRGKALQNALASIKNYDLG
ncbi:dystrophin-like [Tubulanus polymorphus]|uniref:dystrophin-like n=1 Tax=Tubulanus polymorphus TaxID=672921 RepID=UPI003DA52079